MAVRLCGKENIMLYEDKKTKNISFPLGGIGTGSIGLTGNGELSDWEIFNRPNKNSKNGYSHFAIKASYGDKRIVKVLHGDTNEDLMGPHCASRSFYGYGFGPRGETLAGFPHFRKVTFDGEFPIARLTFTDDEFPASVRLTAFNPLIPHDEYNSGLPAAFFEWEIENTAGQEVLFSLAATLRNPAKRSVNEKVTENGLSGIFLRHAEKNDTDVGYTDLTLLCDGEDTDVQEYWYRGSWNDGCTTYWRNLCDLERMPERSYAEAGGYDHGTVVSYVTLKAGEKKKLRFIMSWNVPVYENYWNEGRRKEGFYTWRNYYATQFKNSYATAKYALEGFERLLEKTSSFTNAIQTSSLPESVKDAVSANLSVLKTPTALRLEDGSFWGWEGSFELGGSCMGTCQHVWNYAYAMPYLFPRLERSIRENTMKYALTDSGASGFRIELPPRREMNTERPCLDGQMGEVIKCYREWKLSGDNEWLKKNSESIFKMLEYAWSKDNPDRWDADCDGVLEGRQHHTLDMELFGPSSWLEGFYLLALDCGAKMARAVGQSERAEKYDALYKKGKSWMNENLFNGKYFFQKVDLFDKATLDSFGDDAADRYWNSEASEIKYQVADGCMIDQMLADFHAALIGADCVFDADKKKKALESLYKYNYVDSMRKVANMWRNFAINDEAGTVICTYPDGAKLPAIPISYCDEVMTGFEYALAVLMIAQGHVSEGETMVKAIRDRYDGEKRNPWNEIECGSNYARSMASFALMPVYLGFTFDMTKKHIGFAPITGKGKYLFSVADSYGSAEFNENGVRLTMLGDPLTLNSVSVPNADKITKATVDGKEITFKLSDGNIVLESIRIEKELILN